jgi:DNA primase
VRSEGPAVFGARDIVKSASSFMFDELAAKADLGTLDGRAQLVALARPLIGKVPPGPLRQLLGQHLKELAGTTVREADAPAEPTRRAPPPARPSRPGRLVQSLPRRAIALLVRQPSLAALARDLPALDVASNPESALLVNLLEGIEAEPGITTGALCERLRENPLGPLLEEILAQPLLLDEAHWPAEFTGAIEQMLRRSRRGEFTRRLVGQPAADRGAAPEADRGVE